MTLKKIDSNIKRIVTNATKLNVLIHETGLLVLAHAKEHGDCTRALALVKAMPASMRRTMLVKWISTFSPIRVVEANDKVGILKKNAKGFVDYDLKAADETPFYVMAENEKENEPLTFEQLVKMVEGLGARITKKVDNGEVAEADVASAKAIADKVTSLKLVRVDGEPVADDEDSEGDAEAITKSAAAA